MHTQRTTTGQPLSISYDATTNTLIFRELDWFADPLRAGGVPAKTSAARRQGPALSIVPSRKRPGRSRSCAA